MRDLVDVMTRINGVAIVYAMALVNSGMALMFSFGVRITPDQRSGVVGFTNAALVLVAHVSHASAKRTKTVIPARPLDESGLSTAVAAEGEHG